MLLAIVLRSAALESYSLKGSSTLDRKDKSNDDDDDEKTETEEPELVSPSVSRRNRYPGYGSSLGGSRSRSRWQSPPPPPSSASMFDDDSSDGNEWGRPTIGLGGLNGLLSGLTGLFNQGPQQFDNTPTCHSILDPQYSLFSDICGVVPQARYSLPNYFGHVERWQIAQALTTLLGPSNPSSGNPSCARSLKLLVCPLLFPPCKTGRRELPPVLPCQPFCRAVKGQCPAPTLDLLPCDFLPPTSELCPVNPTPYSSLLSSFGSPYSIGGGVAPAPVSASPLSSLLAQSALSSSLSSMGALGQSALPMTGFPTAGGYQAQGLGSGFGLSQYLPSGQPLPTQSSYQNYLSSLQTGTHGGAVNGGLGHGMMGQQHGGAVNGGLGHGMMGQQQGVANTGAPGSVPTKPMNNGFNPAQFMAESLQPVLVDFPPLASIHDMRQAGRFFPALRSSSEKA